MISPSQAPDSEANSDSLTAPWEDVAGGASGWGQLAYAVKLSDQQRRRAIVSAMRIAGVVATHLWVGAVLLTAAGVMVGGEG